MSFQHVLHQLFQVQLEQISTWRNQDSLTLSSPSVWFSFHSLLCAESMVHWIEKSHHVSTAPALLVKRSHVVFTGCALARSVQKLVQVLLLLVADLELLVRHAHHLSGLLLGGLEGEGIVSCCSWTFSLRGFYGSLLRVDLHENHQAQDEQPPFGAALLDRWKIFAHLCRVHDPGVSFARAHGSSAVRERLLRLGDPLEGEDLRLGAAHRSEIKVRLLLKEVACRDWEEQTVWSGEHC